MILILTTQAGDYSHIKIVDWLNHLNADYLIITGESLINGQSKFNIQNNEIFINDVNLTKNVSCVFYRRWVAGELLEITNDTLLNRQLNHNIVSELYEIRNYLYDNLKEAFWIPEANSVIVNKLSVLTQASKIGLDVPDYIVTNSKKILKEFYYKNNKKIITKAIGNFTKAHAKNNFIINPIYTKEVNDLMIDSVSESFPPSLFQKAIDKKYEFRILYFNKKCFPTLILSQENKLTEIDSRLHDEDFQARLAPVNIEQSLENKIIELMEALNLNIGCLDFLYSTDNKYYFLEVNPVGQFGGYSERSLLNFEKEIVKELIRIDETRKHNYSKKIE